MAILYVLFVMSNSLSAFRLGKSFDMLQGAVKGATIEDPIVRVCVVVSRLARVIYFVYDVISWTVKAAVIKGDAKSWSVRGAPFWFTAILVCLLRDLYEIISYFRWKFGRQKKLEDAELIVEERDPVSMFVKECPQVAMDTIRNLADVMIPLNLWGFVDLSQGTIGLLGLVSSICGITELVSPHYKLTPS